MSGSAPAYTLPPTQSCHLYGIAVMPPPELSDFINTFREKYNLAAYGCPHLNLRSPFYWQDSEKDLLQQFQQLSEGISAFSLRCYAWKRFPSVLFLALEPTRELQSIHQACTRMGGMAFRAIDGECYVPHLTVGLGILKWAEEYVWQEAIATPLPHFSWQCNELALTVDVGGSIAELSRVKLRQ